MIITNGLRQSGKLPAFLIHAGISAAVVALVGLAMFLLWYPLPYFWFDGGWHVLRIIILVDVVLGPLLTLVVFRRGKPGLRRDLAAIATIQLTALIYGGSVMFLYRPAFVVYAENNFFTAASRDVESATRDIQRLDVLRAPRGPGFVILRLPDDPVERGRLREEMRRGGPPITLLGDYYQRLDQAAWEHIFSSSIPIERLAREDPGIATDLKRFMLAHPQPLNELAFVPVIGRYGVVMFVFERKERTLLGWMG